MAGVVKAQSDPGLAAQLLALEERLLLPEVRASAAELEQLLAADFYEFDSSGRVWSREATIAELVAAGGNPGRTYTISDFSVRQFAPDLVLATYRLHTVSDAEARGTLRSSLYGQRDGRWQMLFHQGTPAAC